MKHALGLAVALLCLTGNPSFAAEDDPCRRKISVVGRAEASHVPNFIALTLATDSKASTVAGAIEASGKAVTEIGALARDLGVAEFAAQP